MNPYHQIADMSSTKLSQEQAAMGTIAMAVAQSEIPISRDQLDTNHWLLNCNNGTLDLKTATLRPHTQSAYLTHCLTLNYNPLATCIKWLAFLHRIFGGNTELITFVQRAI